MYNLYPSIHNLWFSRSYIFNFEFRIIKDSYVIFTNILCLDEGRASQENAEESNKK